MIRRITLIILATLTLLLGSAGAINARQPNTVQVGVESAYIRALPDSSAPINASVFAGDSLIAVGRNIDGTWLQVQRPFAQSILGWIDRRLASYTFEIAQLPLTDFTTGVTGPDPVADTSFALLTVSNNTPLYPSPDRSSETLALLPFNLTLPIADRTPNLQWLRVNYRGTLGWVPAFLINTSVTIEDIPISPEYVDDPALNAFTVVTRDQQIAQADRLIAFITPLDVTAAGLADYWEAMLLGDTVECAPQAAGIPDFSATPEDIQQLPELRQQLRLMRLAVADLNDALEVTSQCGLLSVGTLNEALANTLNARAIFRIVLTRITAVRANLVD